jgi:DNA-directed RNA polymerase specialized sigma24 family protein
VEFLVTAALLASGSGLVSAVRTSLLHIKAQRALVRALRQQNELVSRLKEFQVELEAEVPDPEAITAARRLILDASNTLNERERKDIMTTLEKGSDRSRANYIAKFIAETSRQAAA